MRNRDIMSLIKNVYDEETLDAIKSFDENIFALMHHNPIFKDVEINLYTRVPGTAGSSSEIRVDVSKKNSKAFITLSEDFMTNINESENIRSQLNKAMERIKIALKL